MARKKIADKSAWKPVRVKKEWLDMIREAHKKNPDFSPTLDLGDASEPHLIHVACKVAALYISGWIWERLTPDLDQIVDLEKLRTAVQVAAFFGAEVRKNADQSLTLIARGKPDYTLPTDESTRFPKPKFIH